MTTLHSACALNHTLVHIVGGYWACECPAVYLRQGKGWLDPQRKGLIEEIVSLADRQGGIREMARAMERQWQDEQAARKRERKKERKTRAMA